MIEQPILQTPRLGLRNFTPADAAEVQRLASAFEVADTTLNVPHPYEDGMAEAWITGHAAQFASSKVITYAVTLKDTGALTGVVSLATALHHRRAELAYWTGVPYWNLGYTTEASAALLKYGFGTLSLRKITASPLHAQPCFGPRHAEAGNGTRRHPARPLPQGKHIRGRGRVRPPR